MHLAIVPSPGWTPGVSQDCLPSSLPLKCCPSPHSYQLAQRTFRTFDFYKKHQEAMTPAGLAFFQCRWDDSVTHTFHQLLGKGLVVRQAWGQRPFLPCQEVAFESQGGKSLAEFQPHRQGRRPRSAGVHHSPLTLLADMREPVFEFVRPPPYHPKQKRFPHQQPLRYLDRYRDSHEPTYGIY